jgi:hypothetical protein
LPLPPIANVLGRFDWTRLPRPVIPLDDGVEFSLS